MEKLYIIIPAYNEADYIEQLIEDWYPVIDRYNNNQESRLVIINDGSSDNTADIVKRLSETRPLLHLLDKTNGGHGQTVLFGYRYAISNAAAWIFQTDSDGQTDPAEFDQFWSLREDYDAIIGSRPNRQDGLSRKIVEATLRLILLLMFGVKMPDANAPFRLMKSDLVGKYLHKMPEAFNLPNVMLTTYFVYFKEKIRFKDISFKARQTGVNSINILKIIKIGCRAVTDFRELKKHIND